MSSGDVEVPAVEPMLAGDLPEVVRLHRSSLPSSFFARLGGRYLHEYYRSYLLSPTGITLVVRQEGRLAGFVVGTSAPLEHAAWTVRERGVRLAVRGVLALLVRPWLLVMFLRTRLRRYLQGVARRLRPRPPGPVARALEAPAVLAHVAVDPGRRGRRLGELLVVSFWNAAQARGAVSLELVTLAGPDGAGGFYDKLGFVLTRCRHDDDGREWCYYRKDTAA